MKEAPGRFESESSMSRDELTEWFSSLDPELRRIAKRQLAGESRSHVLQPAALVNEVFLRLATQNRGKWFDRLHFLCIASEAMRRILIETARRESTLKRGGGAMRHPLSDAYAPSPPNDVELLDLSDALAALESVAPDNLQIVRLHIFLGLTLAECADWLGVSKSTAERRWRESRAWLKEHLEAG